LVTERLILNDLVAADADELFEIRGDEQAIAFCDWPADTDRVTTVAVVPLLRGGLP
jgi:hypothetical protein